MPNSDYRPTPGNIVLPAHVKAQIVEALGKLAPPTKDGARQDECWRRIVEKDAKWALHEAVAICAIACLKMGLETPDVMAAVMGQRDAFRARRIAELGTAVFTTPHELEFIVEKMRPLGTTKAETPELIVFLSHRGAPPMDLARLVERSIGYDGGGHAVYFAIRVLAGLCLATEVTPVDVHEAVRQVRDRFGPGQGERRIFLPG